MLMETIDLKEVSVGSIFSRRLKETLDKAGMSGYRLAQLTGIAHSNMGHIITGKRAPSKENMQAIADVPELGVSFNELRGWADVDGVLKAIDRAKDQSGSVTDPATQEEVKKAMLDYLGENP